MLAPASAPHAGLPINWISCATAWRTAAMVTRQMEALAMSKRIGFRIAPFNDALFSRKMFPRGDRLPQ